LGVRRDDRTQPTDREPDRGIAHALNVTDDAFASCSTLPARYPRGMCRNIRQLHNFAPPATEDEIRASAIQYVRKVSGFAKPSKANEDVFDRAVADVTAITARLLGELVTNAPPKDREIEAAKARARSAERYARTA
jgi:hypothetical protein